MLFLQALVTAHESKSNILNLKALIGIAKNIEKNAIKAASKRRKME